ncbi:DUF2188 domain-containing protein [Streptomyces sp. NPDC054854]
MAEPVPASHEADPGSRLMGEENEHDTKLPVYHVSPSGERAAATGVKWQVEGREGRRPLHEPHRTRKDAIDAARHHAEITPDPSGPTFGMRGTAGPTAPPDVHHPANTGARGAAGRGRSGSCGGWRSRVGGGRPARESLLGAGAPWADRLRDRPPKPARQRPHA